MNAKELIRFAFGDAIKDTPAGPVLMAPEPELKIPALDPQPAKDVEPIEPEPCSCDEALALHAELDAKHATLVRVADEARALRTELARTRFMSVVRGRLCDAWSEMLDAKRAESADWKAAAIANANVTLALREELAEAQRRLREDKHADNTLEWRHMVDALRTELAEAKAVVADKAHVLQLYAEQKDLLEEARHIISGYEMALPECANCGKPAACMGSYESDDAWAHACDECCGHGNEDGQCFPLSELPARFTNVLKRVEKAELEQAEAKAEIERLHELRNAVGRLAQELTEAKRAAETWEDLAHGQEKLGEQADALVRKFQELAVDAAAKMSAMEVSMNAAYTERNRLVAFLARVCIESSGIRRTPIEGWNPEWTNCVFIDTNVGQMSWHYHDSDAHLFASLPPYEKPWDGHTTPEKYERLWRLTELTAAL